MVHITGDFHGNEREFIRRFKGIDFAPDDIIVVLGDAGVNYMGSSRDKWKKEHLNLMGVDILLVHGNHELRPSSIPSYHKEKYCGGLVFTEAAFPHLKFAIDGEVYELGGKRYLVIGGAYSADKDFRLSRGEKWFCNEQPDDAIKSKVEKTIAQLGFKIDGVLTHTCPLKYIPTEAFLKGIDQNTVDRSTEEWLDAIEDRLSYEKWYCGHWHIRKTVDSLEFIYTSIFSIP